jgi:Fe2+ transport system protein FeoA
MNCSLAQLKPGQIGQVVTIQTDNKERLLKLALFGLVPGSFVKLQQRHPAYVIRIGETLLSLDKEVAENIQISCQEG